MGVTGLYFPYFRGKQYELIAIRESAELLARSNFVPIVEPVRESTTSLVKAIDAVSSAGGSLIAIVNPTVGDFAADSTPLSELARDAEVVVPAYLLSNGESVNSVVKFLEEDYHSSVVLVHAGFEHAKELAHAMDGFDSSVLHVFSEHVHGKLYRKHFGGGHVLLRDGFRKQKNRDYPSVEAFSDLHATFQLEGASGFGDYLVVGDEYSEAGGPAYAVAIHLTFIDQDRDEEMCIHHFVSDRFDTPSDPAGKFAEALDKLVAEVNDPSTKLLRTSAVDEYLELHRREHFPGLGYVKKLSMLHHLETMSKYFEPPG